MLSAIHVVRTLVLIPLALLSGLVALPVRAELAVNASVAATRNSYDTRSLESDVAVSNSGWWQVGVGGGSGRWDSNGKVVHGTSLRAYLDGFATSWGARGYVQRWQAAPYVLDTFGMRPYLLADNFRLALTGEVKKLSLDYLADPFAGIYGTQKFSGAGWGGSFDYWAGRWVFYTSGMKYHYNGLSRYLQLPTGTPPQFNPTSQDGSVLSGDALPRSTLPGGRPDSPGLQWAVLDMGQGLLSHQFTAGIGRSFDIGTVYVDWTHTKDTVYSLTTQYYGASYLFNLGKSNQITTTLGVSQTYQGKAGYGGVVFSTHF